MRIDYKTVSNYVSHNCEQVKKPIVISDVDEIKCDEKFENVSDVYKKYPSIEFCNILETDYAVVLYY